MTRLPHRIKDHQKVLITTKSTSQPKPKVRQGLPLALGALTARNHFPSPNTPIPAAKVFSNQRAISDSNSKEFHQDPNANANEHQHAISKLKLQPNPSPTRHLRLKPVHKPMSNSTQTSTNTPSQTQTPTPSATHTSTRMHHTYQHQHPDSIAKSDPNVDPNIDPNCHQHAKRRKSAPTRHLRLKLQHRWPHKRRCNVHTVIDVVVNASPLSISSQTSTQRPTQSATHSSSHTYKSSVGPMRGCPF